MRHLILFDIDGTLIAGGPAKDAFHHALLEVFGTAGDIDGLDFSGKTDPQIARELLGGAGMANAAIDEKLPAFFDCYLGEFERRIADDPVRVLPGVPDLLDALDGVGDVALGLLTGNIAGGADIKLGSARLRERFDVGSFGSDSEVRDELPPVALERAASHWSVSFEPARVWIVGDTPRDVGCARAHGLRSLAVATGNFSSEELGTTGADHVVDSLHSTERIVELLT